MSQRRRRTEEIVREINETFCPQLERAIYNLADQNYVYCLDAAAQAKKVAQEMKKIRDLLQNQSDNLTARVTVEGNDFNAISTGLQQIAREWFSQHGDFIASCHALGLGVDIEKSANHTTIYAAAKFY